MRLRVAALAVVVALVPATLPAGDKRMSVAEYRKRVAAWFQAGWDHVDCIPGADRDKCVAAERSAQADYEEAAAIRPPAGYVDYHEAIIAYLLAHKDEYRATSGSRRDWERRNEESTKAGRKVDEMRRRGNLDVPDRNRSTK